MSAEELEQIAEEYKLMTAEEQASKLEGVKAILNVKTAYLRQLETEQEDLERKLSTLKKAIAEEVESVRKIWMPFIQGCTSSELALDNGLKLKMDQTLNIAMDDKDVALKWFEENGFKEVMRWDINTNTMKKIAREKYQDKENPLEIPGLKFSTFQVIQVKKK